MSQEKSEGLGAETGRRTVLKRMLLVGLGASALVQPNGAVLGVAFGQDKKEGGEEEGKKKKKKKGGEEPKKD